MKKPIYAQLEDKPINNRPIVFFTAAFVMGIFLGGALRQESLTFFLSVIIVTITLILLVFFQKRTFIFFVAMLLAGLLAFFISYSATEVKEGTYYQVVNGRISEQYKAREGYEYSYLLTNVTMSGETVSRNAVLYCDEPFEIGNLVTIYGEAEAFNYQLFNGYSMSYYSDKVNYRVRANSIFLSGTGKQTFFEKTYLKIKDIYLGEMGDSEGGVALSLMFGDRSFLDAEIDNDIRASGLAHIFSVSGLHVAFLAATVFFVLRLLKVNKKVSLIIISLLLLAYGMMTGFRPSLIRAGIMLIILLGAQLSFKRFDPLSALSFAAAAILVFRPLYIFEIGFQMSVASVLGIFCFYHPIKRLLNRRKGKVSNFVSSSLAMSLSANSFLIAIIFNTFSFFGLYFCLGNIVVVPFIGLIYSLLVFITLFALFIPPAAALMIVPRFLISAVVEISAFISSLPYASLRVSEMGIFAMIYIFTLLFVSKFAMVDKQRKLTAVVSIIGFSVVLMLVL